MDVCLSSSSRSCRGLLSRCLSLLQGQLLFKASILVAGEVFCQRFVFSLNVEATCLDGVTGCCLPAYSYTNVNHEIMIMGS